MSDIQWTECPEDPSLDWVGRYEDEHLDLYLFDSGVWKACIDGIPIYRATSRENALQGLLQHLGLDVPTTAADIEKQFKAELKALLAKYGASIEAEDQYEGYPEDDQELHVMVTVPSKDDGERSREGCRIDLGELFDGGES